MIGVFDSGVGGLSVLRQIRRLLPAADLQYVADQAHVPYGQRSAEQVRRYSEGITRFLLEAGASMIVVACNTASAAALDHLRQTFPDVPFVGMEPAVKPGAAATRSGIVGVLATAGTFDSERYARLRQRFAAGIHVLEDPCPGLVEHIEAGQLDTPQTCALLQTALTPMLEAGVDSVVLGCTHYPFVLPLIEEIAGGQVTVIDPAPAVARQVQRIWQENGATQGACQLQAFTSGSAALLAQQADQLVPELAPFPVTGLQWQNNALRL
jgi:glutamate racemase